MSNAWVTGGTGFIGSHLVRALLERGDAVTCIARRSSSRERIDELRRLGAQFIETEPVGLEHLRPIVNGCDYVYHVAGATRARSRSEYFRVNRDATLHLLCELARLPTPPVVVVVSSLAAAGPSPRTRPRVEGDGPAPVSWYGRSKLAGELAARTLAGRLPISIVRPPMVLGPGDTTSVQLFRMLRRAPLHLTPGFGVKEYSLVFAEELVRALIAIAHAGERLPAEPALGSSADACWRHSGQGLYYVARDRSITYGELGRGVAQAVGRQRIVNVPVPKSAVWCMASWNELVARACGRATFFGWDKWREATTGDWTCSAIKAKRQLGFQTDGDLNERLCATFEWYRDRGWL